jgi:hypothetical protein
MSNASTWLAGKRNGRCKVVEICGMRPSRQELPKDHYEGKGRLIKEFPNFLVRIMALCGNFRVGLLTPLLILQIWGFDNSLFLNCNTFQSRCDAYACEDTMHMLVRYGAHDAC